MAKKKKKRHIYGKKEFLFNFFSLIAVILIGLYFGGRSFYYYSKQSMNKKIEEKTLNGLIIQNNQTTTEKDGLHQDDNGYYFKGNVSNNYVLFGNRLFQVIRINSDNSVKVVSQDIISSFMWGEDSSYHKSNIYNWLEKSQEDYSGVYYDTIPNLKEFLVKTTYTEDMIDKEEIKSSKEEYQDYITLLGIHDYVLSNGKSGYLNNGKMFYLLGNNSLHENIYVEEDGSIQFCDSLEGYGIRPVFTFKSNIPISGGDGSIGNPYIINQGDNKNYVGSYVQLGNDIWRVYSQSDNILKLQLNDYIKINSVPIGYHYSNYNSIFDLSDKTSLATYLNTTYLSSIPYANVLLDFNNSIGEISDDAGYNYYNIYKKQVPSKIGLLNIFDYHLNYELEEYYHINTTSEIGSMAYVISKNGLLKEADVKEEKFIVPTISIDSNILKSGSGTIDSPYIMG